MGTSLLFSSAEYPVARYGDEGGENPSVALAKEGGGFREFRKISPQLPAFVAKVATSAE
jgi:hypothetical protein